MEVISGISNYNNSEPLAITVGTFDGVHSGHLELMKLLEQVSSEKNIPSAVLTFHPHPRKVLNPDLKLALILSKEEKIERFRTLGIDKLIILEFDLDFSRLSSQEFVEYILVKKLNVKAMIIGYDHHFGKSRQGNYHDLEFFAKKHDFELHRVEAHIEAQVRVSSTKIRHAIQEAEMELTAKLLSYPFFLIGKVEQGAQIGRTIGFPTANISLDCPDKIMPKSGVYIVEVALESKKYHGILNIGTQPTVDSVEYKVEVHILDFSQSIYGKQLKVSFLKHLRDVLNFDSLEDLKIQIANDVLEAEKYFNSSANQ